MSYSVILPTLNEKEHIIELIKAISKIFIDSNTNYEIIVVDDDSTDGTKEELKNFENKLDNLRIILRQNQKRSLPQSINDGVAISNHQYLIWLDADFQHPPEYIKRFIELSQKHKVIVCSRFLQDSKRYFNNDRNNKDYNENQSVFFNKLCNKFIFKDISDFTSGFICINKKLLMQHKLKGYYGDYFLNLIYFLKSKKIKILEIPFTDHRRKSGFSKTVVRLNLKYIYTCFRYLLTFSTVLIKTKFI